VFRALENLDQAQEMAEARRLFYVAATRAKERLILAGKEPRRKKDGSLFRNGQSWQRWLEEALDIQDEHRAAGLWGDAEARTQVQINRSAESGEAVQFLPEKHVLPEVDLAYRHELPNYPALSVTGPGGIEAMRSLWRTDREAWWLRHRSQLMPHVRKPLVDSRDREEAASLGTVIGTLVHRVCQMGFTDSCKHPDQLDDLLKAMAVCELDALVGEEGSRGAAASEVQAVVAAVKAIWRRLQAVDEGTAAIRALLDARGQPEVPFRLRIGGWQISGRYDKLVQRANGLEVVDWKTDADPEIQLILTRHRAQMQLYALALWRSGRAHVQADSLSVHLAMLHHMRVEVLRFPADELAAFESELSTDLKSMCRALDEGPVARLG
jgi:ATP-dependent exoDNAse (exonuclease V) beta subunit